MADKKESTLSIIIKAVDRTTAGMQSVQNSIRSLASQAAAPFKMVGEKLGAISKATGLTAIVGVAGAIASAIKSAFSVVSETIAHVVTGVLSLVSHFDDLGDKAEKLGVSVDFLSAMRYAAERSGSSVQDLDEGLATLTTNLGAATTGTGKMVKFLSTASPALLAQLKAAKGTDMAFRVLADAMSRLPDAARRAKLAQATVGNAALAPLLARGRAGLMELQGTYIALAGSQEEAAEAGGQVDDQLRDLKVASEGMKSALMRGLAPALLKLIPLMTQWLAGHREAITEAIINFGEKLPGAIDAVGRAIQWTRQWVEGIIDDLGGWDVVSKSVGDFLKGQFLTTLSMIKGGMEQVSIAIKALVFAFDSAPVQLIIDSWSQVAAVFERIAAVIDKVGSVLPFLSGGRISGGAGMSASDRDLLDGIDRIQVQGQKPPEVSLPLLGNYSLDRQPEARRTNFPTVGEARLTAASRSRAALYEQVKQQQAKIVIDIKNAPKGTRVQQDPANTADVDMTVGYQVAFGA